MQEIVSSKNICDDKITKDDWIGPKNFLFFSDMFLSTREANNTLHMIEKLSE